MKRQFPHRIVLNILAKDTGRYHPGWVTHSPTPSDIAFPGSTARYRSSGHHTIGVETVEEAGEICIDLAKQLDADVSQALLEVDTIGPDFHFTLWLTGRAP